MKRSLLGLVLFAAGTAFAQCEAPAPVSKLLAGPAFGRKVVESQADVDARAAAFRDARAQYPDNYFILRRELQVSYFNQPEERLRVAREWHAGHPGSPMFELLEAFALEGRDTPQAIRRLEALEAGHPEMERVPLELGSLFGSGRFKDKTRAAKELTAYWKLCPESIDGAFLSHVSDNGSPEQVARAAVIVRKRLEAAAGDPVPDQWEDLWRLEFKAHPLAEHAAVRKQIAADLSRFEKSPRRYEVEWEVFLRNGYESMGDQAAVERMSDEIVEQHPESAEARRTVEERWRNQNAPGPATDPTEAEARARASLAANREWHKRWPEDADILHTIFNDLARLPETTPEQFAAAVDEFQAAYRKKADFFTTPPIEFRIAQGYIKYKIRLDQVPALVETGYQDGVRRNAMNLNDDRNDDTARGMFHNSLDSMRINSTGILLDYYILARQPERVKQAMARVDSVDTSKPFARAGMAALRAKAAEAEARKADALLLYRSAIDARQGTFTPPNAKDELADGMARMWKDLGGTAEGFALLSAKPKPTEATDNRWERPPESAARIRASRPERQDLEAGQPGGEDPAGEYLGLLVRPLQSRAPRVSKALRQAEGPPGCHRPQLQRG